MCRLWLFNCVFSQKWKSISLPLSMSARVCSCQWWNWNMNRKNKNYCKRLSETDMELLSSQNWLHILWKKVNWNIHSYPFIIDVVNSEWQTVGMNLLQKLCEDIMKYMEFLSLNMLPDWTEKLISQKFYTYMSSILIYRSDKKKLYPDIQ